MRRALPETPQSAAASTRASSCPAASCHPFTASTAAASTRGGSSISSSFSRACLCHARAGTEPITACAAAAAVAAFPTHTAQSVTRTDALRQPVHGSRAGAAAGAAFIRTRCPTSINMHSPIFASELVRLQHAATTTPPSGPALPVPADSSHTVGANGSAAAAGASSTLRPAAAASAPRASSSGACTGPPRPPLCVSAAPPAPQPLESGAASCRGGSGGGDCAC